MSCGDQEMMMGINHNNHFCEEYLKSLEKEREKIQMFCRELPLCLQLVTQEIEACKKQMCNGEHFEEELSESDEQIVLSSKLGHVVGDFFPISPSRTSSDEDQSHSHLQNNNNNNFSNEKSTIRKSDWLKSAQLWNQHPDSPTSSGALHSCKRVKQANSNPKVSTKSPPSGPKAGTSSSDKLGDISKNEKESKGKARRSWSQELHNRFLHALQQLGGSHAATPKQIREIMKVDGLTNDEVKSHLQKYRLHERRPNASLSNNQMQAPQFLVVGGIWVPPPEYATVQTTPLLEEASRTANRVYAPVAALPPHQHFNGKR